MKNFIGTKFIVTGFVMASNLFGIAWAHADEMNDPTRPPAAIFAPEEGGDAAAKKATGLQTIIISQQRRAAIIDGVTVELGGKHGDSKLIEVNPGNVVLLGARGKQVLTLFPTVRITPKLSKVDTQAVDK
ncbi:MAG: hypothetical protein WCD45_11185 [Gallionella sp.]